LATLVDSLALFALVVVSTAVQALNVKKAKIITKNLMKGRIEITFGI
jgi:hypothetical protein